MVALADIPLPGNSPYHNVGTALFRSVVRRLTRMRYRSSPILGSISSSEPVGPKLPDVVANREGDARAGWAIVVVVDQAVADPEQDRRHPVVDPELSS